MKLSLSIIGACLVAMLTACGGGDPAETSSKPVTTTTIASFAGMGTPGSVNATGTAAKFTFPYGIAMDSGGDLYVADQTEVRKVTSAGVVTSIGGVVGTSNRGIVVDGSGTIYVSDSSANLIRKIDTLGVVTVFAGGGVAPFTNGTGTAASFNSPYGLALDSGGNLYVADRGNHAIRKITSAGVVTTLAGSAAGTSGYSDANGGSALFNYPSGVVVDSGGNVLVADSNNQVIRKIAPNGDVSTLAGAAGVQGDADGTGNTANFRTPAGVAVDSSGNIYVADTGNNMIRKITTAGVVSTLAGNGSQGVANGTGFLARFYAPTGIAGGSGGVFYIADSNNYSIRKMTITTTK